MLISLLQIEGESTDLNLTGINYIISGGGVTVIIGSYPCHLTSYTQTSIQCTVGPVPAGVQPVVVNVHRMGEFPYNNGKNESF